MSRHYVRGHFRDTGRNKRNNKLPDKFFIISLIIIGITIAIANVPALRAFIILVVILIALFYLLLLFLKYKRTQRFNEQVASGDFYAIGHHCPTCNTMNDFKYPKGSSIGVTMTCHKCGIPYTRYPYRG